MELKFCHIVEQLRQKINHFSYWVFRYFLLLSKIPWIAVYYGAIVMLITVAAYRYPPLRLLEDELPDAT